MGDLPEEVNVRLKGRLEVVAVVTALLLLLASSCNGNWKPIIGGVTYEPDYWTAPSGSIRLTCNASDKDGDPLSYQWSATGGSIIGTGAVVNWTAPQQVGMYDISVVVSDPQGASATAVVALVASNGPPPVIHSLNVTADHKYLKETATGYKVGKEQVYHIECIASGTSNLTYEWSCTHGTIAGEGFVINWTAPNTVCTATVTAKVFDELGNWVRDGVLLEVVPCSSCTFG